MFARGDSLHDVNQGEIGLTHCGRDQMEKDMIFVHIGPDMRIAAIEMLDYLASQPRPETRQDPAAHNCINLRLPSIPHLRH